MQTRDLQLVKEERDAALRVSETVRVDLVAVQSSERNLREEKEMIRVQSEKSIDAVRAEFVQENSRLIEEKEELEKVIATLVPHPFLFLFFVFVFSYFLLHSSLSTIFSFLSSPYM